MERGKTEKGEIERLAELRAKARVDSWGEQFKSPWGGLFWAVILWGLIALLLMWIFEVSVFLMILVGFLLAVLGWFFYYKHKDWEQKQFREFYEEELLRLKLKK